MAERKRQTIKRDKSFTIHPDMLDFYQGYKRGGPTMDDISDARDKKLEDGQPFWNTDHDEELRETAKENTDNAITGRGWGFPRRRRRGK